RRFEAVGRDTEGEFQSSGPHVSGSRQHLSVRQHEESNQAETWGRPNEGASSPSKGMPEEGIGSVSGLMTEKTGNHHRPSLLICSPTNPLCSLLISLYISQSGLKIDENLLWDYALSPICLSFLHPVLVCLVCPSEGDLAPAVSCDSPTASHATAIHSSCTDNNNAGTSAVIGMSVKSGTCVSYSKGDDSNVGVAHHTTGAQHLIVAGICTHRADEHGDEDHQHQDQHNPYSSRHQGLPPDAESGKGLRCQRGSPGGRNGDCFVWGACHRRKGSGDPEKSCERTGECVRSECPRWTGGGFVRFDSSPSRLPNDGGKTRGGSFHPGSEDQSLSKPQLSPAGSLWSALTPSVAGLQQRDH
ncbi:hypothetical protein JOQ06_010860, partial [Pogonophryne albipinna]